MKVIFLGTPELAVDTFRAVCGKYNVVAVVTQPDKPKKRSKQLIASPIAQIAEGFGIDIYKPEKIDSYLCEKLREYNADVFVTFAYGKILTEEFLNIAKMGGINIHPSMLPKYRGASPIQSAVLNGECRSGITVQKIAYKVDSGDILYQETFEISEDDDVITLERKIQESAAGIILKVLDGISSGEIQGVPQVDEDATYCKMFKKEDGEIDWGESKNAILNKVKAFVKWPGAFTHIGSKKLTIFNASLCNIDGFSGLPTGQVVIADLKQGIIVKVGDGFLALEKLQLEGKKVMDYKSFLNGYKDLQGAILK